MKINSKLDAAATINAYRVSRKLHIPDYLEPADAAALHAEIAEVTAWNFVVFAHGKNIDLDAEGWGKLDAAAKRRTEQIVHDRANHEFAYMHFKLSLYDR